MADIYEGTHLDETRPESVQEARSFRVTLKDIALRSGYTVNTVSHALRGKSDISVATRRKIVAIAQDMGYVGNTLASSLRSGRSKTVAVIISDVVNPHFSNVVDNVESILRDAGYTTIVLCTGDIPEQECQAIRTALSHLADGVLICPSQLSLQPINLLRQSGIPYVVMGREFLNLKDNYVLCDDLGGARLLTQSLIARGHERILYVSGEKQISSERERLAGYTGAMREAGLAPSVMPWEQYQARVADDALAGLLEAYHPTAVVAFRDAMAWTIINQLRDAGVRVPEDVSVAGFDYIAERLGFLSPLTTVAAAGDSYSTVACRRLLELISAFGERPPETVRLPMRLVAPEATVRSIVAAG
ncbi:MAG: LacI family DNA-binding transcriptional regulator [Clostridia bacterium]